MTIWKVILAAISVALFVYFIYGAVKAQGEKAEREKAEPGNEWNG